MSEELDESCIICGGDTNVEVWDFDYAELYCFDCDKMTTIVQYQTIVVSKTTIVSKETIPKVSGP